MNQIYNIMLILLFSPILLMMVGFCEIMNINILDDCCNDFDSSDTHYV